MRYLLEIYYIEEHFDRTPFVHIVCLALYEIVTICLNIVLFLVQIFEFDSFRTKCTYQEKKSVLYLRQQNIQNDLDKVY